MAAPLRWFPSPRRLWVSATVLLCGSRMITASCRPSSRCERVRPWAFKVQGAVPLSAPISVLLSPLPHHRHPPLTFDIFEKNSQKAMVGIIPLGVGAGIVGATILAPFLTVPVLNVVGFSAAGPVAGSLAAGLQATIGNVAAGSLFATAQATAMGAGVPVLAQGVGGVFTGVAAMVVAVVV
ncbi:hypothetical protein BJ322DRAFT_823627 [Thelephora terrestris]|uniref:Uncharacterized protein n=1 Tax=Thelephora terrestris TaxID=56493 RepID=A0A9P6HEU9_9AGAM|nr:hypothetical protein BJ322DRAFT_823627 [Thelephora terrestris]